MSCSPPSVNFVKFERYEKSCRRAADSLFESFGAPEIMLVRTVEVRSGMGLSGSLDCVRRGRKELYGLGCSEMAFARAGLSTDC